MIYYVIKKIINFMSDQTVIPNMCNVLITGQFPNMKPNRWPTYKSIILVEFISFWRELVNFFLIRP